MTLKIESVVASGRAPAKTIKKKEIIISADAEIIKVTKEMKHEEWNDDVMEREGICGFEKLKEIIKSKRTWFKVIEEDFDILILSTNKHGDSKRMIPGYRDMREARKLEAILNEQVNNEEFSIFMTHLEDKTELVILSIK